MLNLAGAAGHRLRERAFVASDGAGGVAPSAYGRRIQAGAVLEWGAVVSGMASGMVSGMASGMVSGMVCPFGGLGLGCAVIIEPGQRQQVRGIKVACGAGVHRVAPARGHSCHAKSLARQLASDTRVSRMRGDASVMGACGHDDQAECT